MSAKLYIPISELSLYKDVHRSGWNFVVNNLYNLDIVAKPSEGYEPADDTSLTLLDTFLDRTFHWDYEYLKSQGALPYKRNWIGFVHHTFNEEYTIYNAAAMFRNPDFIESLKYCRGIFTLSETLKWDVYETIYNNISTDYLDSGQIVVESLIHPTESVPDDKIFSLSTWLNNTDKKIIHVGAWLRDMFAIYRFPDLTSNNIRKCILIGPNMENYVKPADFDEVFYTICNSVATNTEVYADEEVDTTQQLSNSSAAAQYYHDKTIDVICRDIRSGTFGGNKFIQGIYSHISTLESQVTLLPGTSDDEYDTLLSQNLVYIQLYDASAINTLIECIVRHTPIVINPLPAVVELLGTGYPFYYDQNKSQSFVVNSRSLQFASSIMRDIDVSGKLTIDYFNDSFLNSMIIQAL